MSRTAPATHKTDEADPWILGRWKDLGLVVLSPLWVIPLLWLAKSQFDPSGFGAVILAVGGTGHHLPGFIRAYTDPTLFQRFRTRFILAPLFLLVVYALFFVLRLEGLKLLLVFWGTWHGAMQVNGFLRIYDAKARSIANVTSWLDWAMCVVWFGGGLLYSSRLIVVVSHFFQAGGWPIDPNGFTVFRNAWMLLAVVVTVAFLGNAWRQTRQGRKPNPVKLLMMVSSFSLWWFAMVGVNSMLVGLLLFEIVHDIQYNALVWFYNKRRVATGMTASRVERFLFQPDVWRGLLYIALIIAYGALADVLDYTNVQAPDLLRISPGAMSFWTGLFMVSTFLHFYFDGFIWQVREQDFRKGLGIASQSPLKAAVLAGSSRSFGMALPSGWKWAFFVVPAIFLGVSEYRGAKAPILDQARNIAALLPDRWQANAIAGSLEHGAGHDTDALRYLTRAVEINPAYFQGEAMIGDIYLRRGQIDKAHAHYVKALKLYPQNYPLQGRLGKLLVNKGRSKEAIPYLRAAAENGAADADLLYVLGATLVKDNHQADGIPFLLRAVQLDPKHKQALNYLGIAFQFQGDNARAANYYRQALSVDPGYAFARENLQRLNHPR